MSVSIMTHEQLRRQSRVPVSLSAYQRPSTPEWVAAKVAQARYFGQRKEWLQRLRLRIRSVRRHGRSVAGRIVICPVTFAVDCAVTAACRALSTADGERDDYLVGQMLRVCGLAVSCAEGLEVSAEEEPDIDRALTGSLDALMAMHKGGMRWSHALAADPLVAADMAIGLARFRARNVVWSALVRSAAALRHGGRRAARESLIGRTDTLMVELQKRRDRVGRAQR